MSTEKGTESKFSLEQRAFPFALPAPDAEPLWKTCSLNPSVVDLLHGHLFLLKAGWGTGEEGIRSNGGV